MSIIYHIAQRQHWQQAKVTGQYTADSLASEGFIHCSQTHQVERVANKFYRDLKDLVLLHIDPAKVKAPVKYESPRPGATVQGQSAHLEGLAEQYPHIYGPLNVDAVVNVVTFEPGTDGKFPTPVAD